ATQLGGNFYTLTYSSSNKNYDGKIRTIAVKLSNKHYRASYRRFYYGNDVQVASLSEQLRKLLPDQSRPKTSEDSLYANMQISAQMSHEIYFKAHMSAVGTPALATSEQMANLEEQPAYFRERKKNKPNKPLSPVKVQTYAIDYTLLTETKSSRSHL